MVAIRTQHSIEPQPRVCSGPYQVSDRGRLLPAWSMQAVVSFGSRNQQPRPCLPVGRIIIGVVSFRRGRSGQHLEVGPRFRNQLGLIRYIGGSRHGRFLFVAPISAIIKFLRQCYFEHCTVCPPRARFAASRSMTANDSPPNPSGVIIWGGGRDSTYVVSESYAAGSPTTMMRGHMVAAGRRNEAAGCPVPCRSTTRASKGTAGATKTPINQGFPDMNEPTVDPTAGAKADVLTKARNATEKLVKGNAEALTSSGNAAGAAVLELIKAYQELAARNAKNLTAAIQVSRITLSDEAESMVFDGLPTSASQTL